MVIDKNQATKIADLARLAFTDEDLTEYARSLADILELITQVNADITHVTAMSHPLDAIQRLRVDQPMEGNQRQPFQAIAPDVKADLYLVPNIIE